MIFFGNSLKLLEIRLMGIYFFLEFKISYNFKKATVLTNVGKNKMVIVSDVCYSVFHKKKSSKPANSKRNTLTVFIYPLCSYGLQSPSAFNADRMLPNATGCFPTA